MWAKEYALSDNFFASAIGPSYPNHYFYIAGQSGGVIDNPENIDYGRDEDGNVQIYKSWGCDAIGDDVFVFVKDRRRQPDEARHVLHVQAPWANSSARSAIDWAYYAADAGQSGYFWNAYNGIHDVFHDEATGTRTCVPWTTGSCRTSRPTGCRR